MEWLHRFEQWIRGVEPENALIIGASATGLTSALFLDAYGLRTKVLEQLPAPRRSPRSVVLSKCTLEAYDEIGLKGEILVASNPFARRLINVGSQHERVNPRLRNLVGARILPHAELMRILEGVGEYKQIRVARAKRVVAVSQAPFQAYAILAGGGREEAAYIIAGDGSNSVAHTAIDAVAAPRRVRGWNISGASEIADLPPRISSLLDHDSTLVASSPYMRFVGQPDDPTDPGRIAWSVWLGATERMVAADIRSAQRQEQVTRAARTLERFAPDAFDIVQASSRIAVRAALAPNQPLTRSLGRIVTVGNAFHGDRPFEPVASNNSLLEATQVALRS